MAVEGRILPTTESEYAYFSSDIHLALANIVDYTIFLLCDFNVWPTHEVTIVLLFRALLYVSADTERNMTVW
jgi:hypothetical protein